eukprot:7053958-Alexandrium_andersonii.AAC.1
MRALAHWRRTNYRIWMQERVWASHPEQLHAPLNSQLRPTPSGSLGPGARPRVRLALDNWGEAPTT